MQSRRDNWAACVYVTVHDVAAFAPIRAVWFTLGLSNAASFNAVMAQMQGIESSCEALRFKTKAIRIVMEWMNDPQRTFNDNTVCAVLRLLAADTLPSDAGWASVAARGALDPRLAAVIPS